ncbi:hypothetical protein MtrunA17_Chr6g0467271 [Medicago truncatula]|uniref:Uncharacterized protein n=1 Tax=Medicago truncatula TaxID=3880 RepID=A0A396HK93_MEDTR|nr:hypothetical protein MtrunA17_Chr6g0467271 [Medicago truncatula]
MPIETTDLTNFLDSPPSPHISSSNTSTILNFDHVFTNPILHHHVQHHRHQTTLLVPPTTQGYTNESTRITTDWPQPATHGRSLIARVLRPFPRSDTMPFPNGSRLMVPWSQLEHE